MTPPILVRAPTLSLAFADAALAIGAAAFDLEAIEESEVREVRAHGATPEALCAHFIKECLYVYEVEGFGWRRIEFVVFDVEPRPGAEPMRLHSFLHGQPLESGGPALRRPIQSIASGDVRVHVLGDHFELSIAIATPQ
jgi:Archease protein family (MTH1598/TM1083)